jgi:cytochrome c oxidase cbb3-type subunit 2
MLAFGCQRGQDALPGSNKAHLSSFSWTKQAWHERCQGVRTSYNRDSDLTDMTLTLVPGDPRWLDFIYWAVDNKVAEHQVESYGGTGWHGPQGGVVFHWAPGSHWERDTLASFGFTVGHTIGEHRWMDTMFPDFFEKYGGVYGINLKDRLTEIDAHSAKPWVEFLEYSGGARSPYYRYLFHQEATIDPAPRKIHLIGGSGVAFTYSFERYYHEVREVLTDCRAVDFFEMYDRFGPGFASRGNWARQNPPEDALVKVGYVTDDRAQPGLPGSVRYDPAPTSVDVPEQLPEADAMRRGQVVYLKQCAMCHGVRGDGQGFLAAGFDTKPRDFRGGTYKFRSTASGELPTMADVERTIRYGVPATTMPAWGQFLTDQEIADVARYLIVFSQRFVGAWKAREAPTLLAVTTPPDLGNLTQAGAQIWTKFQCATCHGDKGRGDGPAAATLKDEWDVPIRSTDLTYKWSFKNGYRPDDVYRTLMGGLNGTPMPSYASAFANETDRWALIAFVLSLSPGVRPVLHESDFAASRAERIGPSGRIQPPTIGWNTRQR